MTPDGQFVHVEILEVGISSKPPIRLAVESLARQAAKGWCSLMLPVTDKVEVAAASSEPDKPETPESATNAIMRLDIQNFSRCCADVVRANIKFDTQLIKDLCDGPFLRRKLRAVVSHVRAIRRWIYVRRGEQPPRYRRRAPALTAEKGNLSGKEIQERTAAFVRSEQLINTAEREFTTILEGLRMYLRAKQG